MSACRRLSLHSIRDTPPCFVSCRCCPTPVDDASCPASLPARPAPQVTSIFTPTRLFAGKRSRYGPGVHVTTQQLRPPNVLTTGTDAAAEQVSAPLGGPSPPQPSTHAEPQPSPAIHSCVDQPGCTPFELAGSRRGQPSSRVAAAGIAAGQSSCYLGALLQQRCADHPGQRCFAAAGRAQLPAAAGAAAAAHGGGRPQGQGPAPAEAGAGRQGGRHHPLPRRPGAACCAPSSGGVLRALLGRRAVRRARAACCAPSSGGVRLCHGSPSATESTLERR
jgi:hypothetical protein